MENYNNNSNFSMSSKDLTGRKTVAALFYEHDKAQKAIRALKDAGFEDNQIGILMRDRNEKGHLLEDSGLGDRSDSSLNKDSAVGTKTGILGGGVLGGLLGLIVGIGSLAVPGVGPVIAGGALAEALGSVAVGAGIGALSGGILGALVDWGIPEDEARHFESGFKSGGILVTVKAGSRVSEAYEILMRYGGDTGSNIGKRDVHTTGTTRNTEAVGGIRTYAGGSSTTMDRTTDTNYLNRDKTDTTWDRDLDTTKNIEVTEEVLKTDKHEVKTGEVRVRKDIITENKHIEVPVTREEVVIERHKVDRPSNTGINTSNLDTDEVIRVPVTEEQVTVNKTPTVKEEVSIGKKKIHDTETIDETVKKERLRLENEGKVNLDLDDDIEQSDFGRTNYKGL